MAATITIQTGRNNSNFRHGHRGPRASRTYKTWAEMRQRTTNSKYPEWHYYGGRGITCCARWALFVNFLEDMGERPEGKSLDRIDNDGNYEPHNCRWATPKEQVQNRRAT